MNLFGAVPTLPAHIPKVNQTAQWIFTLGQIPPIIVAIVLAVRWARGRRTLLPMMILLGGVFMSLIEPVVDHNGLCWFPTQGQWRVYTAAGVAQPIWLIMAYLWFFGGQSMVVWRLLDRGMAAAKLWTVAAVIIGVDIALEHPGLYMNLFLYYGHQPFAFTRYPLWWGFVNGTSPIVAATIVYKLAPRMKGWLVAAPLLLLPMADGANNAATAWPVWDTITTSLPAWVVWLAGLATLGLCVVVLYLCTLLLGARTSDSGTEARPVAAATPVAG
jgi:hypothetical protein